MKEVLGKTVLFFVITTVVYMVLSGVMVLTGQNLGELELLIVLVPSVLLGFYLAVKIGNRLFK